MLAWTIFYHPIRLSFDCELWLLVLLCAAVGAVYKAIRVTDLRQLPREILLLLVYMLVGLTTLAAGLWAVQEYWP